MSLLPLDSPCCFQLERRHSESGKCMSPEYLVYALLTYPHFILYTPRCSRVLFLDQTPEKSGSAWLLVRVTRSEPSPSTVRHETRTDPRQLLLSHVHVRPISRTACDVLGDLQACQCEANILERLCTCQTDNGGPRIILCSTCTYNMVLESGYPNHRIDWMLPQHPENPRPSFQ
jgi:hypothetical protein